VQRFNQITAVAFSDILSFGLGFGVVALTLKVMALVLEVMALALEVVALLTSLTVFTLRAKLSGAVYCNRCCLFVCVCVFVCLWVCYHDNMKLRASIFTKVGL